MLMGESTEKSAGGEGEIHNSSATFFDPLFYALWLWDAVKLY